MPLPAPVLPFLQTAWLNERLRLGGWRGDQVQSAVAQPLTDAVAADAEVWRLSVVGRAEGATMPVSLILKLTNRDARLPPPKEARFYEDIASRCAVRTPRCYFAGASSDGTAWPAS